MTWLDWHRQSEGLVAEAEVANRVGRFEDALLLYKKAADLENRALDEVDLSKARTYGILAVSATSLFYRARAFKQARQVAFSALSREVLPEFAEEQLKELVQAIWMEESKEKAGVAFVPGQVTVSIKGGDVVFGGAPLDLIVDKVQTIQSMFYRTIEYIKGLPHRRRGGPSLDIQSACRPWLFQAPPGSYQFSVAIQQPVQSDFFKEDVRPDQIASHFLEIVKATADEQGDALASVVPDKDYRATFLKLSRNLAPTGRSFDRMEIKAAGDVTGVNLAAGERAVINRNIKRYTERPVQPPGDEDIELLGNLRAVHLDKDWIEVIVDGAPVQISGLKDAVDDVIGPMVNKNVIVRAVRRKRGGVLFRDIEIDE